MEMTSTPAVTELQATHKVVAIVRDSTNKAGAPDRPAKPMWRCTCADGTRFNVFQHDDPARNTIGLFEKAGYYELLIMEQGERLGYQRWPIAVTLAKPAGSQWWEVVAVAHREEQSNIDPVYTPDAVTLRWLRNDAIERARTLVARKAIVFDTETTNRQPELAEITQICGYELVSYAGYGGTVAKRVIETYVRPRDIKAAKLTEHITGLAPEMLEKAPAFEALNNGIWSELEKRHVAAYNAQYDVTVLRWAFARIGEPAPVFASVTDAMQLYADFAGVWDEAKQGLKWFKLAEACEREGIALDNAHDASADALATAKLLQHIAQQEIES